MIQVHIHLTDIASSSSFSSSSFILNAFLDLPSFIMLCAVCTGLNINSVNFLILWHSISHFKKATGLLTHNVVSRMEYHSKKHDNNCNTLKQKLQVLDRHSLGINETISCHLNSMGLKPFFPKHIHSFLMRQQNTFLLCVNWLLCVRFNYSTSCPSEGRRMDKV